MDENNNAVEMRRGDGAPSPIRALKRIDPNTWDPQRLLWLWNRVQSQDYAFDDTTKGNHEIFLSQIFSPNTEAYEYGDVGFLLITGITPLVSALIHFVSWEDIEPAEILAVKREMLTHLFNDYKLARVTGVIPSFNKQAIRLATITGFRYEGELRKAFLRNGTYYNLQLYGILREEFMRREVQN
jgi:hypothetical protein